MVEYFSQKDSLWAKNKLGSCSVTFAADACFITSLGNILGKNPVEINDILIKNKGYVNGCNISGSIVAPILGLTYAGSTLKPPKEQCIAETRYYTPGQHFFLWRPGNEIVDPLDLTPAWKKNIKYPIVSYRLFKKKDEIISNIPTQITPSKEVLPQNEVQVPTEQIKPLEATTEPTSDVQMEQSQVQDEKLQQISQVIAENVKPTKKDWIDYLVDLISNLFKR